MFGCNKILVRNAVGVMLALAIAAPGQAQDGTDPAKTEKQITALQLKLRQSDDNSKMGAKLLLQLADLADENGKPFTLIRAAKRFVISNPKHERQPELMLKLIDAQLITARDSDAISTARQFVSRHPGHPEVADVHRMLAGLLERNQQFGGAAAELTKAFAGGMGHLGDAARAVHLHRREGSHRSYAEAPQAARTQTHLDGF